MDKKIGYHISLNFLLKYWFLVNLFNISLTISKSLFFKFNLKFYNYTSYNKKLTNNKFKVIVKTNCKLSLFSNCKF